LTDDRSPTPLNTRFVPVLGFTPPAASHALPNANFWEQQARFYGIS
jgi:hypothetical protein